MHSQEMCSHRLLSGKMVDIGARNAQSAGCGREADGTGTGWAYGREVGGVGGVAEVEGSGGVDCVAETLREGREVRS